jgi:UDP-N-acetylglucosamine--N-acetylmuramyl-(pentapeptide) pyrophosphoryl-undecaprenol N-acetylglucosamine transferase
MKTYTAMIMAGGTGGHIFPGLAVADELRSRGWKIVWLGSKTGMENRLIPQHGIALETVRIQGVRGNGLWRQLMLPWMLLQAFYDTWKIFARQHIDIAIGFGGYVAFSGAVIARIKGSPLVIHEQNATVGLTNKILSKIAQRVLYAFPHTFSNSDGLVGNPVRADITRLPDPQKRFAARQGALRLLVIGGSLGAKIFNDVVPAAIALLPVSQRPYIVHQAGVQQIDTLNNQYAQLNIEADCRAFIDNMADEYARADIVLCRAGALTIAELIATGVGSLLVPYPFAVDDHQTSNAHLLVKKKAALIMQQPEFLAENLAKWLGRLTREKCFEMACMARTNASISAHQRIADICESLVKNAS